MIKVEVSFERRPNADQSINQSGEHEQAIMLDNEVVMNDDSYLNQPLSSLSGGQKAVVATCLIFAVQKIDVSPFYILDEFDSALDTSYCQGIANVIKKMSHSSKDEETGEERPGCQFIITSFKPHMISCADQIFEVLFQG